MKKPTSGVIHFINSHPIYNLFRFQRTSNNVCLYLWGSVANAVLILSTPLILLGVYIIVGDMVFGIETSIPQWVEVNKVMILPIVLGMVLGVMAIAAMCMWLFIVIVCGTLWALDMAFDFGSWKLPDLTKICPKFKDGDNE